MFNGDPKMFSWWKSKMYSHIIGMDEELWDILEEGVGNTTLYSYNKENTKLKQKQTKKQAKK